MALSELFSRTKQELFGACLQALIEEKYAGLAAQEYSPCPQCGKVCKRRRDASKKLDDYRCAEYLHALANAQYGKGETFKGREWVAATLTRLFHNQKTHVLADIKRMVPASPEAEEKK